MSHITITPYRPEHAARFAELNRDWLEGYGLMEPPDEAQLRDPEGHFLTPGGQILVALDGDALIGTCAIAPHRPGELELAKLAVVEGYRGQGIARRLVQGCLDHARALGARRVTLMSNGRLQAAVRLYASLGFVHRPLPPDAPYQSADVYMVLELDVPTPARA